MKKLFLVTLMTLSAGAMAQTTGGANNGASSSATTSAQGNNQAVMFSTPSNTTTQSTLSSNQNIVNSGTTQTGVDYQGSYTIKNVPSVNGPNLTTSNDTCMGSSSASANGPGVGISFGTTWTDEHCKRLKMSRELWNKGMKAASLAMDCMDPQAMAALEMTGTKCPQTMTAQERMSTYGPQAGSSTGAAPVAAMQPAAPAVPTVAAAAPAALVFPVETAPPAMASPVVAAPVAPAPAPQPAPPAPIAAAEPATLSVAEPQIVAEAPVTQVVDRVVATPVERSAAGPAGTAGEVDPVAVFIARHMAQPAGDFAAAPQASDVSVPQ